MPKIGMMALLSRTHPVDDGPRVRLRLAHLCDTAAVLALLERQGVTTGQLDTRRLLAHDPARRTVLAAFAPLDGTDTLVGLGAIDLHPDADLDTLVVDGRCAPGLARLLREVLRERARLHARRVA